MSTLENTLFPEKGHFPSSRIWPRPRPKPSTPHLFHTLKNKFSELLKISVTGAGNWISWYRLRKNLSSITRHLVSVKRAFFHQTTDTRYQKIDSGKIIFWYQKIKFPAPVTQILADQKIFTRVRKRRWRRLETPALNFATVKFRKSAYPRFFF